MFYSDKTFGNIFKILKSWIYTKPCSDQFFLKTDLVHSKKSLVLVSNVKKLILKTNWVLI